jgi:2-keto-4-pentenoate hydratase
MKLLPLPAISSSLAAAHWLVEQHRGRRPHGGFPLPLAPRTLRQAYAVQDAFVALKARRCGRPLGWKIALSNPAMQRFCGLSQPVAGRLHSRQVVGSAARCKAADYGRLLVEFEIAVELGADLSAPPTSPNQWRAWAAASVGAVRPAIELADDRGADYRALSVHALQLVADNAWNEGAVLGERRTDWDTLDLAALRGEVLIDGQHVGEGVGSDLMGHPLDALAWLARCASDRGQPMRRGEVAILGSLVTSKFPKPSQHIVFRLQGFRPLHLHID